MTPSRPGSISDRARNGTTVDAQDGLFDKVIEDGPLLEALEERAAAYEERRIANAKAKAADQTAKTRLEPFNLAVGEVARIGRFKIKRTPVASRDVSFEVGATDRLVFGFVDGEGE